MLYPQLKASELVGTDLIQAVPLVGSAALGHILFGDFKLGLTTSLLIGSVPGVYIGARVSAIAPGRVIRRALAFVLTASALKLLNVGNVQVAAALSAAVVFGPLVWRLVRSTGGLRRDWEPAPAGHGQEFLAGGAATSPGGADVIPSSGAGPAAASEPAELAGQGR
jgi:hypothetical protein